MIEPRVSPEVAEALKDGRPVVALETTLVAHGFPDGQGLAAARAGHPESGAVTLEWIVIAGILVAAALAAGIMFNNAVSKFASKLGG